MQRHQCDTRTTIIGGVLAQRQLAVEMYTRNRLESRILVRYTSCALLKLLRIDRGPPVAQIALCIEVAPLIVESVRQLVTDHHPDTAIVDRIIQPLVEERRLQDSCREVDVVLQCAVIRIYRRRSHAPLRPVHRLADLVDLPVRFELRSAEDVPG